MSRSLKWLFWLKFLFCIYGVFIFGKFTYLGDSETYLATPLEFSLAVFYNNTSLVGFITALLKKLLVVNFFVHLVYLAFTFWGLSKLIKRLNLPPKNEFTLVVLLSFPSFAMWTSVVSKESLTCFFSSFVIIWILDFIEKKKRSYSILWNIICVYFLIILRPPVGIGVVLAITALFVNNLSFINKYIRYVSMIIGIILGAIVVYILAADFIQNEFLPLAKEYFNPQYYDTQSSRSGDFWLSEWDIFLKAPYGIFLANLGPTLFESLAKPQFLPYFFEGLAFWFVVFYYLIFHFLRQHERKVANPNFTIFFIFLFLLILFVNYPFGVFNPGSATRYRSSYFHIIIVFLYYFHQKDSIKFKQYLSNSISE